MLEASRLSIVVQAELALLYNMLHRLTLCSPTDILLHFEAYRLMMVVSRDPRLLGTRRGAWFLDWLSERHHPSCLREMRNPYHAIAKILQEAVGFLWLAVRLPTQRVASETYWSMTADSVGLDDFRGGVREAMERRTRLASPFVAAHFILDAETSF